MAAHGQAGALFVLRCCSAAISLSPTDILVIINVDILVIINVDILVMITVDILVMITVDI